MKLKRAPRLFGSSTTTVNKLGKEERTASPIDTIESSHQTGSKSYFRKSPLVMIKRKLSTHSSPNSNSADDQIANRRNSDKSNNEPSKLSKTDSTSRENSNVEEVEEDDSKKCLDFRLKDIDKNEESQQQEQEENPDNDVTSVATQEELPTERPSSPERRMAVPPKKLFKPPKEVMIDPHAVPPSPMKDPAAMYVHPERALDNQTLLPNLGNNPQSTPYCLGDPVGDIAMKRQLLDAQRLVRLILGKPLCGDQHLLETTTILQAIRAFAMMKQELVELRKKQEVTDGDPPAILQELGSPIGASTVGARTENTSSSSRTDDPFDDVRATTTGATDASLSMDDVEAIDRIQKLEEQLEAANKMIDVLKQEREGTRGEVEMIPLLEGNEENYRDLHVRYHQLLRKHEEAVEASQRTLDAVIDSVASVPKKVLAKDSVREKLKAYCTTVNNHSTQLQIMEVEARIQQERQDYQQRLAELEEKMRIQEEEHHKQLAELQSCSTEIKGTDCFKLQKSRNDHFLKENVDNTIETTALKAAKVQRHMPVTLDDEKKIDV